MSEDILHLPTYFLSTCQLILPSSQIISLIQRFLCPDICLMQLHLWFYLSLTCPIILVIAYPDGKHISKYRNSMEDMVISMLRTLQQKSKWPKELESVQSDTVVSIKENLFPLWKMASSLIRVANVCVSNSVLKIPKNNFKFGQWIMPSSEFAVKCVTPLRIIGNLALTWCWWGGVAVHSEMIFNFLYM